MRILLVEDDALIAQAVRSGLKAAGHAADVIGDGASALSAPRDAEYDCVLLDLGLPGMDGVELLRLWRGGGLKVPVIVITARDGVDDRVKGLDLGADDYVVKPFSMEELLARLRAVTRRRGVEASADCLLTNGAVSLDTARHEAWLQREGGRMEVSLTSREFSLLETLLRRPGSVLSRAQLEGKVYGYDDEVDSNAVEFLIHNLRRKIGSDQIKNVRGVGWKIVKAAT